MARDTDALKIEKWAASGDVEDPEDGGMTRSAGWDATYSQPGGSLPKREHFNQLFRELTALALEVNTRGCGLEWSAEISYLHPAFVTDSGGKFYFSVQDSTNVDPTGDANNATWTPDITEVPEAPGSATVDDEGLVELATGAETQTGTDDDKAVTPASLASRTATTIRAGLVELATQSEVNAGTDDSRFVSPATLASRLNLKAPLASPAFTGNPTAPTPAAGDNDVSVATTAFVVANSTKINVYASESNLPATSARVSGQLYAWTE